MTKRAVYVSCNICSIHNYCMTVNYFPLPHILVATVSFDQQVYTVSEAGGRIEPVLVLSNPSSSVIAVQVFSTNGSATGKQ